jgi:hypothetical protein
MGTSEGQPGVCSTLLVAPPQPFGNFIVTWRWHKEPVRQGHGERVECGGEVEIRNQ